VQVTRRRDCNDLRFLIFRNQGSGKKQGLAAIAKPIELRGSIGSFLDFAGICTGQWEHHRVAEPASAHRCPRVELARQACGARGTPARRRVLGQPRERLLDQSAQRDFSPRVVRLVESKTPCERPGLVGFMRFAPPRPRGALCLARLTACPEGMAAIRRSAKRSCTGRRVRMSRLGQRSLLQGIVCAAGTRLGSHRPLITDGDCRWQTSSGVRGAADHRQHSSAPSDSKDRNIA
jgi:hypothetical protein